MVFNPSFLDRISHVYMGCWQAAAFFVISVSAFYLLRRKHIAFAKGSLKIGIVVAVFASLMQLVSGHSSAQVVAEHQPAKLAAMEGHYAESAPAGIYVLGWPDDDNETTVGIEIPGMLSYLIYGDTKAPVTGLTAFPPNDRPPVNIVFQSYHLMVGIGFALIAISLISAFGWWRGWLFKKRRWLWLLVISVLLPQAANQLGWITAEVGRQPWIVYGLLRTSEGLSKSVTAGEVGISMALFGFIYLLLFVLFIYLLNEKIQHGPEDMTVTEGRMA
jgi:cytochrome d ubiquinol oxidase subunit I